MKAIHGFAPKRPTNRFQFQQVRLKVSEARATAERNASFNSSRYD